MAVAPEPEIITKLPQVSFSHVHLYVDHLDDLTEYKALEHKLNAFCTKYNASTNSSAMLAHFWHDEYGRNEPFEPQHRDIVKQWIVGLGFRITGARYPSHEDKTNTRSVLVTSRDPQGVQFVVTATAERTRNSTDDSYEHFDAANLDRFYKCHSNRQGIAVLAFDVDSVDAIFTNYEKLHPKLIVGRHDYESAKLLEVFAYYNKDKHEADTGTILRFIEHVNGVVSCPLPGLHPVAADFDQQPSQPAYCDHWVSNVYDRTGFLTTLQDTLGFTPKVDFNAGVVAAGEAQIESTVTGNDTPAVSSKELSLRNQTQVYLPINNALSNVGHVHGFLNEIGQGIQHVASRVDNLVEFVQRANDWRQITGEGFSFLRIPRSYYGILSFKLLVDNAEASEKLAISVVDACQNTHITSADGAVFLELEEQDIEERLQNALHGTPHHDEYSEKKACILSTILKSRYINLHSLLRDHISESSYLGIVQNQILVDVQGDDLLYQIFTSNVLQRHAGDEAPFLEFIQRVCSECINSESGCPVQIKPGCGGFGIRNFLTLFLSIEVSKAMLEVTEARVRGDEKRQVIAQAMVDCFTDQLDESNPILTEISDAMTRERECQDMLAQSNCDGDREFWRAQLELASEGKTNGNKKLMDCSTKYKERMVAIRSFGVHQQ